MMTTYELARCVPMLALLGWAAAEDVRSRRVPNWLTFALVLGGIGRSFLPGSSVTPGEAGLGFLAAFVTMLAGIGAWVGVALVMKILVVEAVLGMAIVLARAAREHRIRELVRGSAVLAMNLARGDFGEEPNEPEAGERLLPFAVPLLVATLAVIAAAWSGRGGEWLR